MDQRNGAMFRVRGHPQAQSPEVLQHSAIALTTVSPFCSDGTAPQSEAKPKRPLSCFPASHPADPSHNCLLWHSTILCNFYAWKLFACSSPIACALVARHVSTACTHMHAILRPSSDGSRPPLSNFERSIQDILTVADRVGDTARFSLDSTQVGLAWRWQLQYIQYLCRSVSFKPLLYCLGCCVITRLRFSQKNVMEEDDDHVVYGDAEDVPWISKVT